MYDFVHINAIFSKIIDIKLKFVTNVKLLFLPAETMFSNPSRKLIKKTELDGSFSLLTRLPWPILLVALYLSACARDGVPFNGLDPSPRDVNSPQELPPELAQLRVFWWMGEGDEEQPYFMRLDGSDPIPAPQGCVISPSSERYLLCLPDFGNSTIELVDLVTGDRRVLVKRADAFPDALHFGYPSYIPEENEVIYDVAWSDHIELATVNIENDGIAVLDIQGTINSEAHISPDGRWILESCEARQASSGFVLCLVDRENLIRTYLIDGPANVIPGSAFTTDGQSVVYSAPIGSDLGESQLHRIDLDNLENHVLVSGLSSGDTIRGATFTDVVFSCRFPEQPACSWLCTVGLDGTNAQKLAYLGDHCIDVNAP